MWCEKCHFGGETITFKVDKEDGFLCNQCRSMSKALYKSPFATKNKRTLGGREVEERNRKENRREPRQD